VVGTEDIRQAVLPVAGCPVESEPENIKDECQTECPLNSGIGTN